MRCTQNEIVSQVHSQEGYVYTGVQGCPAWPLVHCVNSTCKVTAFCCLLGSLSWSLGVIHAHPSLQNLNKQGNMLKVSLSLGKFGIVQDIPNLYTDGPWLTTYDFSTSQYWESDMHSTETMFRILNVDFSSWAGDTGYDTLFWCWAVAVSQKSQGATWSQRKNNQYSTVYCVASGFLFLILRLRFCIPSCLQYSHLRLLLLIRRGRQFTLRMKPKLIAHL